MKNWSAVEITRAEAMWADRYSRKEIATAVGRSEESVAALMARNRSRFPRRQPQKTQRSRVRLIHVSVIMTDFLNRKCKAAAKRKRMTKSDFIRELLRKELL